MPCTYKTQKRGDGRVAALNKCPVCGLEYTLKKYDVKGVVKSIYIPEWKKKQSDVSRVLSILNEINSMNIDNIYTDTTLQYVVE